MRRFVVYYKDLANDTHLVELEAINAEEAAEIVRDEMEPLKIIDIKKIYYHGPYSNTGMFSEGY